GASGGRRTRRRTSWPAAVNAGRNTVPRNPDAPEISTCAITPPCQICPPHTGGGGQAPGREVAGIPAGEGGQRRRRPPGSGAEATNAARQGAKRQPGDWAEAARQT